MGLLDTLQTVVQDEIGKQSSTVLGTVIAFYDGTCTVRTDEGTSHRRRLHPAHCLPSDLVVVRTECNRRAPHM